MPVFTDRVDAGLAVDAACQYDRNFAFQVLHLFQDARPPAELLKGGNGFIQGVDRDLSLAVIAQRCGLQQQRRLQRVQGHFEVTGFLDFLDAILAIHVCILIGYGLNAGVAAMGLDLPLFVTCLFAGILMTNLVPRSLPRFSGRAWPSRTPQVALIADVALGTFLAMSLMSLQLWTLIEMAGPILAIMTAQFVVAVAINLFIVFPALGKNYDAAVVCSGFGGISLGSTPTAMANMSAVTTRYGASHLAFIVVPLVCAKS